MKVLAVLIAFMASCSSLPQSQGNRATQAPTHKELQLNIPNSIWEPIFFKSIEERAELSNLRTLRESPLRDDDLEIRVWHGFGVTALQGFILKRAAGQWSAIHLNGIRAGLPPHEYQKLLQPPKSGWDLCWQRLQATSILTLPDASAIGCSGGLNDGMSYVVEYNRDGVYRTYMYENPDYARCDEAKRMIEIGSIISEEFGMPEMTTK
jgi:hypothetical protein